MKCKTCGQEIPSNPIMEIPAQKLEWGKTCEKQLNWEDAKEWCAKQGNGWRLPTKIELLEAYEQKIDGFTTFYYWSSTEFISNGAWNEDFANGSQYNDDKSYGNDVRCIRSI